MSQLLTLIRANKPGCAAGLAFGIAAGCGAKYFAAGLLIIWLALGGS